MECTESNVKVDEKTIASKLLKRQVLVDFYFPVELNAGAPVHLLLINDGQDLRKMNFESLLELMSGELENLVCIGIHAGEDRRNEYGTAKILDSKGRGAKAALYQQFILQELLPQFYADCEIKTFHSTSIAGFSLGGLSAIDMAWNHPKLFTHVGVFSGSLWWRTKELDEGYEEDRDRIMHQQIRNGQYHHGLRFYFTTGSLDETADRNNNGIIDSIDDTLALVDELEKKGYEEKDICYLNYEDGRHDVETWARALPGFLRWGWGNDKQNEVTFESC